MVEDQGQRARRHQLEALHRVADQGLEMVEQPSAACGVSSPTQATTRSPIAGTSLRLAAVTMPSVPSAPISSWVRL